MRVIIALVALICWGSLAAACPCTDEPLQTVAKKSSTIFLGRVVTSKYKRRATPFGLMIENARFRFKVLRAWKGAREGQIVDVHAGGRESEYPSLFMCGSTGGGGGTVFSCTPRR